MWGAGLEGVDYNGILGSFVRTTISETIASNGDLPGVDAHW